MYRHFIVLIFSLVFAGTALCQDEGRIECGPGTSSVPAWTAPGGAHVVEQLVCGQMVSVTGLERGYVRIQIGDRIGYVDAKYVRMPGSADRRTGDLARGRDRVHLALMHSRTPLLPVVD